MTYYSLSPHVYIAKFRDQVILMDTKKDKYIVCAPNFANILLKIVHNQKFVVSDKDNLNLLLKEKVILRQKTPYLFYTDCKPYSKGVSNIDWRLPLDEKKTPFDISIIKALLKVIKVNFYIKFLGFDKTICLIKNARKKNTHYYVPSHNDLKYLAGVVNRACLLYPRRTKCLEWSIIYVLLALQKEWKCNLEIGVQNYPFMAHAWVECDGKIVMDSQDLREGLAIILNEPFRKKII